MLMECLIEREGPTEIRIDQFVYHFRPDPKYRNRAVCPVLSSYHRRRLIDSGNFREYKDVETVETKEDETDGANNKTGGGRRVWTCEFCGRQYKTASSLSRHKKVHLQ